MKKLLLVLMALCLLLGSAFAEDEEIQYDVDFDAYADSEERAIVVEELDWEGNQTTERYGGIGLIANLGTTIGECVADSGYLSLTMDAEGFEGWMIYKSVVTIDEFGDECSERVKLEDTLYTTEEVLAMDVPEYDVLFVAKWADIDAEDYFAEVEVTWDDMTISGSFSLGADGGMMTFAPSGAETEFYTYWVDAAGQTLDELVGDGSFWEKLATVEKEGATLTGWKVYQADNVMWGSEPAEEGLSILCFSFDGEDTYFSMQDSVVLAESVTTEELYAIVTEETNYLAVAIWE